MKLPNKDQVLLEQAYNQIREGSYGPIAGAASRAETNPGIVGPDGKLVQGAAAMDKEVLIYNVLKDPTNYELLLRSDRIDWDHPEVDKGEIYKGDESICELEGDELDAMIAAFREKNPSGINDQR